MAPKTWENENYHVLKSYVTTWGWKFFFSQSDRHSLTGLCHEIIFYFMAYNIKLVPVLSEHTLMVFSIFCFLIVEIIKLKVLACFFEITYKFWKSFQYLTLCKGPKAAISTMKTHAEAAYDYVKSYRKPPVTN
jgi:hypothetical protein